MKDNGFLLLIVLGILVLALIGCPDTPPDPVEPIEGERVILCLRELGTGTLDEIDECWQIRESIDAADEDTPPFLWLPASAKDERLQPHGGVRAYSSLGKPLPYCWDIAVTSAGPKIINEGPPDASVVLGWVGLAPLSKDWPTAPAIDAQWLDVDFSTAGPELTGMLPEPEMLKGLMRASLRDIRQLRGFEPIPKSQWPQWCERFPLDRLVGPIYHTTEQVMGSCVGNGCMNGMEGPLALMFGRRTETWLSAMSIYHFIGRSPGSGAMVGDAASRIGTVGILPADDSPNADEFDHTHQATGGFYDDMPSGYESTAAKFLAGEVFRVTDEESAFAVSMRDGLRWQIGRQSHSISSFGVARKGAGYIWLYENSWGTDWGSHGKSIGYDSRMYSGYVYVPVVRDEIQIPVKR